MESIDSSQELSAAECASRTGLTVRALRVYEELGLIAPRRSASGWRQYGPHDLVKLNTIALLKTAGLTLAQIRGVTGSSARELGTSRWRILLSADGKIALASYDWDRPKHS